MKTMFVPLSMTLAVVMLGSVAVAGDSNAPPKPPPMEPRISVVTLGVSDLNRSFRFYKEGLGFPTKMTPDGGIVLFATTGTRMFLYPYTKLAEDVGIEARRPADAGRRFAGITFGHCVRKRELVDEVLKQALAAGGKIVKPAKEASWGGYSGYFSDPDGYLWEVAYSDKWTFNPDGSVKVDEGPQMERAEGGAANGSQPLPLPLPAS
jgi:catechol 2,3-dioxygenase-like lactoylglutathione lyase family enzyme